MMSKYSLLVIKYSGANQQARIKVVMVTEINWYVKINSIHLLVVCCEDLVAFAHKMQLLLVLTVYIEHNCSMK